MTTDASPKGWGASWGNQKTGGQWSTEESALHINVLELKAVLLTIQTVKIFHSPKSIHLKMDNALSYIVKMGGTKNLGMIGLSKEIWDLLISMGTTITVEYLPSRLNKIADWESRNCDDSSEWKLDPQIIHQIYRSVGGPDIDLFASRLSHQLASYISWRPDPGSRAVDALRQSWRIYFGYGFPPSV